MDMNKALRRLLVNMDCLPHTFAIFTVSGVWRPLRWLSGPKKHIYDCYTFLVLLMLYLFGIMEFVDIVQNFGNIEQMISASFMLVTTSNTLCKAITIVSRHKDIINVFGILNDDICRRKNKEEDAIQAKINIQIRNNTMRYFCFVQSAVVMITISSVVKNVPERTLPFKAWIPLNYSTDGVYWCFYYHQVIAHAGAAMIAIGYDTLVPGIMLLTSAQLKILKFRYGNFLKDVEVKRKTSNCSRMYIERKILEESVSYHRNILQFAKSFNEIFSIVIFIQYAVSSFVICMSVYRLAGMEFANPEYPFALFYLLCMITQIFCFCWYGNELLLESLGIGEAIYKTDWPSLHVKTQKDLLMIINRTMYPIMFTSGKVFVLSLESFTSIMKLSYTAFNVLSQK